LLERNPHYFFQKIVLRVFESLFGQLPVFLQQKNAFVFSAKLAVGIAEARELALRRFVAFSQSNGYRVLSDSHGNRAFVQKTSGFGLVRDFSVSGNHPLPEIVEWHFSVPEKSMAAKKPVFGSFSD
jgi:hypothetical protein